MICGSSFNATIDKEEVQRRRDDGEEGYRDEDFDETFDITTYPFSEEAFQDYIENFIADGEPVRTHLDRINKIVINAIQSESKMVSREHLGV